MTITLAEKSENRAPLCRLFISMLLPLLNSKCLVVKGHSTAIVKALLILKVAQIFYIE